MPSSSSPRWWLLLLILWLSWAGHGGVLHAAQNQGSPTRENLSTRVWQTRDGLPQETVQAVAQTPDGFLWIGTTGGLLRFDGSRFTTYDRSNTEAIRENSIFCLTATPDGTLWIGTEGGGLVQLRDGHFRRFSQADKLFGGFIRAVLDDGAGRVWVGTDDGLFQMAAREEQQVTRIDNSALVPAMAVHALALAPDGSLWAGGSRLIRIRAGQATEYPLTGKGSENRVKSILDTPDGTVWVGTVSGLDRLRSGDTHFTRFPGVRGTVRTLRQTSDGTLWIGTIGEGAWTLQHGVLAAVAASGSGTGALPSRTVLSLAEDSCRNLWMGTQAGLVRFSRSSMRLIPLPNTSDSDFETVSHDTDDSLWVASTGLTHLVHGIPQTAGFPALQGARVRNVFRTSDGTLWLGTDGRGIFHLDARGHTNQFTVAEGLVNNFIRGMVEAEQGGLWIATDEGISHWSAGGFRNYTVRDGLGYFSVRALLDDGQGGLWIGTDRGLSHLAGRRFAQDAATRALAGEKVWALFRTPNGTLWAGTRDNGLYRFAAGTASVTHFTADHGLTSNSIYDIQEDRRGRLWMSGAQGVAAVQATDLDRLAQNPQSYVAQRFFPVSTGGELPPLYGGTMPAGTLTADGNVWFPTSKGLVEFLTGDTESASLPDVFLDGVTVDGRAAQQVGDSAITLRAGNRDLEFSYGAIQLGAEHALQLQYRLEGFDQEWRPGSNLRIANYTNLPAGRYVFRVRAFQESSGAIAERSLTVVKQQYFFLTWWFLACGAAGCAVLAWWLHRRRLRRVETQFQAVLEERARLAREMHDTLIQGCTGVSLLLEAASAAGSPANPQDGELLNYARTQLAASIDEARQAIWNLRGQAAGDLDETLQSLAERVDRSSNVAVLYRSSGESYSFEADVVHEIGMASREAIYNALLHADPTHIDVHAAFQAREFLITIEDDGSGFVPSEHAPEGHFGLRGIHERVRALNGTARVHSQTGHGTTVSIRIPRTQTAPAKAGSTSRTLRHDQRRHPHDHEDVAGSGESFASSHSHHAGG